MARDFTKLSPRIWQSDKFRGLPDDATRLAYLYYLTSRHQESSGVHNIPDAYAAADLGWPFDTVVTARKALMQSGLLHYDEATHEAFINDWFKFNPPMSISHATGIRRFLEKVESDALRELAEEGFQVADDQREANAQRKAHEADLRKKAKELRESGYGGNVSSLAQSALVRRGLGGK